MNESRARAEARLRELIRARPAMKDRLLADPHEFLSSQLGIEVRRDVAIKVIQETAEHAVVVLPYIIDAAVELSDADLEMVAGGHALVKEADCGGSGTFQTVNSFEASVGAAGGGGGGEAVHAPAPRGHAFPGG
jgi:hypothetical protein